MTVKEMKEELAKYPDDREISVFYIMGKNEEIKPNQIVSAKVKTMKADFRIFPNGITGNLITGEEIDPYTEESTHPVIVLEHINSIYGVI